MLALLGLLGKLKYIIILAVLGGFAGNACAIAVMTFGACCVAKLIDPSFTNMPMGGFIALTIIAGVLRGLLRFIEQYNNHYIAFKLLAALRDRIFGALRKLAPAKLEGKQKGAIIAMLTSDVETLEVFYAHTISPIMIAILVDGTVVILACVIGNVFLGLTALAAYIVIGIIVPFLSGAALKNEGVEYRKQFSETSGFFLDSVKGIREIVLNNRQDERLAQLDSQSEVMNRKTVSIKEKSSLVSSLTNLIVSAVILITAYEGVMFAVSGRTAAANIIVVLVMIFSSFGPVLSLAALPGNLTQTFASGDRILDFMEEKPVVIENEDGEKFDFKNVAVEDLSFSYGDVPVIENANMFIEKGSITGIEGPSGCGKSTLLKLLLRFYDPESGSVKYNGTDLRNINTASLHENVTMVSQDTYLFNDTIFNNLVFARPGASLEEVREACRKASVDDFISSLPDGYDTEAGLLGDSLSAGEKQRIGLARAFLSGAPLILLDEATSNVDAINEGIILKSLKDAAPEHTIVLVSHRETTMSICSKIYHIRNGRLA